MWLMFGVELAASVVQVPGEAARLHASQDPVQTLSQHTPSTHLPRTQSVPAEHAFPKGKSAGASLGPSRATSKAASSVASRPLPPALEPPPPLALPPAPPSAIPPPAPPAPLSPALVPPPPLVIPPLAGASATVPPLALPPEPLPAIPSPAPPDPLSTAPPPVPPLDDAPSNTILTSAISPAPSLGAAASLAPPPPSLCLPPAALSLTGRLTALPKHPDRVTMMTRDMPQITRVAGKG